MTDKESKDPGEMTLLILERGAPWPSWAGNLRSRANHSAVEVQAEDESSESFAARIRGRVDRLAEQGVRLIAAGYVCAADGPDRMAVRRQSCAQLLQTLDQEHQPELLLGAGDWHVSSDERGLLIELWGELSHQRSGTSVSVCFDQDQASSGTFRTAPQLPEAAHRAPQAAHRAPQAAHRAPQAAHPPLHKAHQRNSGHGRSLSGPLGQFSPEHPLGVPFGPAIKSESAS